MSMSLWQKKKKNTFWINYALSNFKHLRPKKKLFNIELPKIEGFTVLGVVSEVDLWRF